MWSHWQKLLNLIGRDSRLQTENQIPDPITTKCQLLSSDYQLFTTLLFLSTLPVVAAVILTQTLSVSRSYAGHERCCWSSQPPKPLQCCTQEIQANNLQWKSSSTLSCLTFVQCKFKKCGVYFHADLAVRKWRQFKSGCWATSKMLQIRRHRTFELVKRYYNQNNPIVFQPGERHYRQDKSCPFELAVRHSTQYKTVSLN